MLDKYRLILGSASPRRKRLMEEAGFDFEVRVMPVDEIMPREMGMEEAARHIARVKGEAFAGHMGARELLITADTVVGVDDRILGKPGSREEAVAMLERLSGRTHEVCTGVCLTSSSSSYVFSEITEVCFAPLRREEIAYYVDVFKPYDKAGAYGIQEWIGYIGIKYIRGCFYNVMGLPVRRLYELLTGNEMEI